MAARLYPPRRKSRDDFELVGGDERQEEEFDLEEYLPHLGRPLTQDREEEKPAEKEPTEEERLKAELRNRPPEQKLPPPAEVEDPYADVRREFEAPPEPPLEFADLAGYDEWKRGGDVTERRGPVSRWRPGYERGPGAQKFHELVEQAGEPTYEPGDKLYSWVDPLTGTLNMTGNPAEVPPAVAATEYQKMGAPPPPEPERVPEPAPRLDVIEGAGYVGPRERPGEMTAALTGLADAARAGQEAKPGGVNLTEAFQQREAQAADTRLPGARERGDRNAKELEKIVPKGMSFTGMMLAIGPGSAGGTAGGLPRMDPETADRFSKAMLNVTGESEIAGKVAIPLSIDTDLETNINALPKQTFWKTMGDSLARRKTDQPGVLSTAAAWADMFADVMSLGGTQQLEFDYARKLVLADPETIEFALSQGVSQKQLAELIFPEGEDYNVLSGFRREGRLPIVRRTQDGYVQDHWRSAAKERPELVNVIARKTRGALETGLAWEHFSEQGILKGLGEGIATDPMLVGELVLAALTGGLTGGAYVASKTGLLRAAAKLQKVSALTNKARVVFAPLETAVGVTARKVIAPAARAAKQPIRTAVGKAVPGAEFDIKRALWKGWETKGGKGRRLVARMATLFEDADQVLAHKNQVVKGMNESLRKLGFPEEVLLREGERIEALATLSQKGQKRKPLLFHKAQAEAEQMLKGLAGSKTVLAKDGQPTSLGSIVDWLDTGKGFDALVPLEQKIAKELRKRLDKLKAQLPEGVGKVKHYFPRFKPIDKKAPPIPTTEKALGKGIDRFWEETRRVDEPAIQMFKTRDEVVDALAKRFAGPEVAAIDEALNKGMRELADSLDGRIPVKEVRGFEVPRAVVVSGERKSLAEAKMIARVQRAKKTEKGIAAADRIEARIAAVEALPAKVVSPALKKEAPAKAQALRPAVKQLEKQLGAADIEVRGLKKPVRRAERAKARLARWAERKKELQASIRQMAKGTAKVKREEELSLIVSRLEKAQAEAAALAPDEKAIQRHARELHKRATARDTEFSLKEAVNAEFTGPIQFAKPKHPGAELEAWKKLPMAWRAKAGQGRPIDTLMQEVLDKNPGLRGEYGAIPDPTRFIDDLKAETAGRSRRRVSDFEQAAEEELLYGVELQEAAVLSKIDDLTAKRESLLRQALEKQADETLEEAEKARWIAGFEKEIAKLDLEHAKIQIALPPERELEQLAKRLDISYKNRENLAKDLASKKRKMREYWDFTRAKKPIYVDTPVDVGKEFVEMMHQYPVVRTDLEDLEKFHRKWILRPFKTTMLGYRPSYALRNMTTASARTINEMINGFLEGKPWAPSWNKVSLDYMDMDSEFIFESMYSRNITTTTKGILGKIPHFVYRMEGASDRFFKKGAVVGKMRAEVGRLARLNQVTTKGKAFPEIVEALQVKGVITDFADLVRKEGVDEANRIFFNFQDRIGLMIGAPGEAFPFAEWGYKNFSYVLRDLTKHPWKMRAWKIAYDQWAYEYQDHPEYSRHVVRLLKDSPLKYFNNWFMQPLWSIGGYQPLQPFLEGTSEYDIRRHETFEPVLERVLERAKAENLTWDEREKLIEKESAALLRRGAGSFRHYLDQNYITGPQTGYRFNKTALKEIINYAGQNLSLGPTAQMALARVGLAKFQGGNRQWLGWQNVVEDLGLAISGTNLLNLAGENRGQFYERKVRQEMDRQQIRGEIRNLREAEKSVGIQNAIIHTVNNLVPISARFIPPEEVERLASIEVRQRAAAGGLAISETPPPDVMKRQFETGEDYPVAKFGVEATRAVKAKDFTRVREVVSQSSGVVALVPLRLSTQSERIEAKRVAAAVDAMGLLPEGERSVAADAYGLGAMILVDTAAPARKRITTDYWNRAAAFISAPDSVRKNETDPELVALPLSVTGIGDEKRSQLAAKYIERLAADAISMGEREVFERVLAEHPEIVEFADMLDPDLVTKQRARVWKQARTTPQSILTKAKKVADLDRLGLHEELIEYTAGLSSGEVTAIKDELGAGRYKELLDDAREIGKFNEASELLQGVFSSEDTYRGWNDLNGKQQRQIDEWFPELDMPELVASDKKRRAERAETEDWKRRIADSNYDVRMRRQVPADVKRRLGNEHQFWFDFFYPSERELAQKARAKELETLRKEQDARLKKEAEFRDEVEVWRKKIEESKFDNSYKGSRVPMKVKRRLADTAKKFEDFFFKRQQAGGGGGGRSRSQATAKARPGIPIDKSFRPGKERRRRQQLVQTARGSAGSGGFEQARGVAGKPK